MSLSDAQRFLVVTADDFGIGPATSRGILELAARGAVTSTVLLVNSPFAEASVAAWRAAGQPLEMGWHPCLTIDAPVLPPEAVPTLIEPDGKFPRLGKLLKRLALGRVRQTEVEAEFRAQLRRFMHLVGAPPTNVNAHHHVHVFRPLGDALARALTGHGSPFIRRVVEPMSTLARIPGARLKRAFLGWNGRRAAHRQHAAGFPGNDTLLGITDPLRVHAPAFFANWLRAAKGRFVELSCHPGHFDPSIVGRDGTLTDGYIHRRPAELELLSRPDFLVAVEAAGFALVSAAELARARSHPAEPTRIAA